ncbi:MAG TPA: energy transducer TonB [Bacillota bacterium]
MEIFSDCPPDIGGNQPTTVVSMEQKQIRQEFEPDPVRYRAATGESQKTVATVTAPTQKQLTTPRVPGSETVTLVNAVGMGPPSRSTVTPKKPVAVAQRQPTAFTDDFGEVAGTLSVQDHREIATGVSGKADGKTGQAWGNPGQKVFGFTNDFGEVAGTLSVQDHREIATGVSGKADSKTGQAGGKPGQNVSGLTADNPPVKVFSPGPVFPVLAQRNNWEGTTLVQAVVKINGKVGEVKIVKTSGYVILDCEAVRTVKRWRFIPALKDGKPVVCKIQIPFTFKLEG